MTVPFPEANSPLSSPPSARTEEHSTPSVNPCVYRLVVTALNAPLVLSGDYLHVLGRENVPAPGQKLVVAGAHVSMFDPFVIARAMPGHKLQFMAKKELFVPIMGDIIRAGGTFPVDRSHNDVVAVRTALRILDKNGTLGLFPQGTRGGEEMHGGVALIALRGRAPILPVGISKQGHRWLVQFGPLITERSSIKDMTAKVGKELARLSKAP